MYERCDVCGTMEGVVRNHMPGKKFACNRCFGDRYRRAAEACARDDIRVTVEHRSLYAFFHLSGVRLEIFASVPENLEELPGVARELVNRVHRIREGIRNMGEKI